MEEANSSRSNSNEDNANYKGSWKNLLSQARDKRQNKQYAEAVEVCNQILGGGFKRLNVTDRASVYNERGRSNLAKRDYPAAFSDFSSAIALSPNSSDIADYYNSRAVAREKIDILDNALNDYSVAIRYNTKNPVFYANRARAYLDKKDYAQAFSDYFMAHQLKPDSEAYIEKVKQTGEIIGGLITTLLSAINALIEQEGERKQTLALFEQALEWATHDFFIKRRAEVFYRRAIFYYNLNEKENALKDCELAIKFNKNEPNFFNLKALASEAEEAVFAYQEAIDLDPTNSTYYFNLGKIYLKLKDYQLAIESFNRAIQLDSKKVSYYWNRAYAFSILGNKDKALTDYDMAVSFESENPVLYSDRAKLHLEVGSYSLALLDFEKAVLFSKEKYIHYNEIGNLFLDRGKKKSAFESYCRAIVLMPNVKPGKDRPATAGDAWYFKSLGFIALYLKEYDKALGFYNTALELRPNEVAYLLQRGITRYKLNKCEEAIEDFSKVLELEPESELQKYSRRASKYADKAKLKMEAESELNVSENIALSYNMIPMKLLAKQGSQSKIKELESKLSELTFQRDIEKEQTAKTITLMQEQINKLFALVPKNEEGAKLQYDPSNW